MAEAAPTASTPEKEVPAVNPAFPITVKIICPDSVLFEGAVKYLFAPGKFSMLGILPEHTPMFAELVSGEITLTGEKEEIVAIESGILRVAENNVVALVQLPSKDVDKDKPSPV